MRSLAIRMFYLWDCFNNFFLGDTYLPLSFSISLSLTHTYALSLSSLFFSVFLSHPVSVSFLYPALCPILWPPPWAVGPSRGWSHSALLRPHHQDKLRLSVAKRRDAAELPLLLLPESVCRMWSKPLSKSEIPLTRKEKNQTNEFYIVWNTYHEKASFRKFRLRFLSHFTRQVVERERERKKAIEM